MTIWLDQTITLTASGWPSQFDGKNDWFNPAPRDSRVNLSMKNTSGVDVTINFTFTDGFTRADTCLANSLYALQDVEIRMLNFTGNGATFAVFLASPEFKPPTFLSIAGTPTVNATIPAGSKISIVDPGGVNQLTVNASGQATTSPSGGDLTSGNAKLLSVTNAVPVSVFDQGGNQTLVPYQGGSAAPADGVWTFIAVVSAAGTPLSINNGTGAKTLLPEGFSGAISSTTLTADEHVYKTAVVKGTTYTITNGTVYGSSGFIGT